MMRSETFLTAQQAIDCGLADGIMQSKGKDGGSDPALAVASAAPWAGALELPPVEDLLQRELERETETEAEAAGSGQDTQDPGTDHLSAGKEKQKRSEPSMEEIKTKEQLAEKYPELVAQIVKEAADEAAQGGAKAERERIAGIDALAMPGFESIIQNAKADPTQNAGTVAMAIVFAQKQAGSAALEQIQKDAKDSKVNDVPAASSETGTGGNAEETMEQAAKAAVDLWKNEGAVN